MGKFSAKNKIIIAVAVWLAISAAVFMFAFNIFNSSNTTLLDSVNRQKVELYTLRAQQDSYLKAKQDLDNLQKESYQPEDMFSKDVTLVNEIKTLEDLGQKLNVTMSLSGIGGTIKTAQPAIGKSDIVMIPYSLTISGALPDLVKYIQSMEHLSFVTNVGSLNVAPGSDGNVTIGMGASFYLQK